MSSKRILPARSILESIREGLNPEQLMDKYGLSPTDLSIVMNRIQGERDRRTTQIIQDFLSGMQVQDIAVKNEFSAERFFEVLRVALSLKLGGSPFLAAETEPNSFHSVHRERRRHPRMSCPVLAAHITDPSCPEREGIILDISEKGVAVKGINAKVDDEKTLLISETNFGFPDPIMLTCSCRWTGKTEHHDLVQSAGVEITEISETDSRYLKSLIEAEDRLTCSL
jgi:hypothetical protein